MKKLGIFLALSLCLSLSAFSVFAAEKSSDAKKQEQVNKAEKGSVFVTKSGKKYHKEKGCSSLKNSKEVKKMSLKDAEKAKMTPCKICYPKS